MKAFLALLIGGLFAFEAAAQQPYPSRPIRFVVGWPPGGTTDLVTRKIADHVSKQTGQTVLVENKPGAGSMIANAQIARAAPDGYTLLVADTSFTMVPATRKEMTYDTVKDFVPIAQIGGMPVALVVSPSLGISSVDELKALSQTKRIIYASGGAGTVFHLLAELMRSATGVEADHVPYKGGNDAILALLAGQVQFTFSSVASVLPHIESGKLKALAVVTNGGRLPVLPDTPTMTELGYKNLAMTQWYGVLAPAGTSQDIVRRVHAEVATAVGSSEFRDGLLKQGFSLEVTSPQDLSKLIVSDLERWKSAAALAKLQPE